MLRNISIVRNKSPKKIIYRQLNEVFKIQNKYYVVDYRYENGCRYCAFMKNNNGNQWKNSCGITRNELEIAGLCMGYKRIYKIFKEINVAEYYFRSILNYLGINTFFLYQRGLYEYEDGE